MYIKLIGFTCAVASLSFLPQAARAADRVAVTEPTVVGVPPSAAAAFAELLRDELSEFEEYAVVPRQETPDRPCGDPACAAEIAQDTGAGQAVATRLSLLQDRVIVRVRLVASDGNVLFSDRTSGQTMDDLDPLATRIARAVATQTPISETATVGTVTEDEAREPLREQALFTHGLRLGAMPVLPGGYGGAGYLADVGVFSLYELSEFAVAAEADAAWTPGNAQDANVLALFLNLGGKYFLDPTADTGWYVGGGLGYRFAAVSRESGDGGTESDSRSGFGAFVGGGAVLLRTANLHIVADARYDLSFFQFQGLDDKRMAHGLLFSVGITYPKQENTRCGLF